MTRRALAPFVFLLAAAFACYGGPRISRLGFYHDDWILLSYMRFAPTGFVSAMDALRRSNGTLLFRPLGLPLYSLLYLVFGLNPLGWQSALLLTNALTAFSLERIMRRYGVPERAALLGAVLFLCWPSKDSTMFWPFVIINSASLTMMLAAYLRHLDYVDEGRPASLALSTAAVVASLALYDQCVFIPALWLVTPRLVAEGAPARARRGAAAAGAATAAFLAYKLIFVPHAMGVPFNKTFELTASHFLKTFPRGLTANLGPRLAWYCLRSLRWAFLSAPLTAAAAAALAWLAPGREEAAERGRSRTVALVVLAAGFFLLGYLPIAVSDYSPTPINHLNRINEVPAAGLILGLIGLGGLTLTPRRLDRAAAALASFLLAVHVGLACVWAESYRRQNDVRDLILKNLPAWSADKVLLVLLPDRYVADKAPVFDAHYDVTGAARIWTGDESRRADTVSPRMDFAPDGAATAFGKVPYGSLLLLEVRGRRLTPVRFRDMHWRAPGP